MRGMQVAAHALQKPLLCTVARLGPHCPLQAHTTLTPCRPDPSLQDDCLPPPPGFERAPELQRWSSGGGGFGGGASGGGYEREYGCHPDKYKTQLCVYFMEQVLLLVPHPVPKGGAVLLFAVSKRCQNCSWAAGSRAMPSPPALICCVVH